LAANSLCIDVNTSTARTARSAHVVHHVPGRLRIKVKGVRGEAEFFASVERAIGALDGVDGVRVNLSSSSIVVDYRPSDTSFHFRLQKDQALGSWLRLDGEDALIAAIDESVTAGARYLERHSRLAESIVSTAEHLDSNLRVLSDGYLDLKVLLPLGIAAATSLQRARGRGTPMWLSLGTFAFNTFLTLHRHRIDVPLVQILKGRTRRA
jgi:copper chaperone CopZ